MEGTRIEVGEEERLRKEGRRERRREEEQPLGNTGLSRPEGEEWPGEEEHLR